MALRAVPERPRRAIGLVRVSKEGGRGEDLLSPEIQEVAITDYAARNGIELLPAPDGKPFLYGIDESGSQSRSSWWRKLDEAVAAVEDGRYDGILVKAFDRTARHRLRWNVAIDRLDTVGGFLESATEAIDVSTAAGRFTRGMFGELAALKAETIGEGWKEVHAARIRSGRPANGKPRYGYRYDRDLKLHVPDPETGPVLADLYRRYVAGESIYQLVRWLNAHGHRTTEQNLWTDRSLRRMLDSGFASGRFMAGGNEKRRIRATLRQGVHEPLISDAEWQAYLDAREGRRARPARIERSQYLLSGMVRCARCGRPMVANTMPAKDPRNGPRYRCKAAQASGRSACEGGYVTAAYVEEHVVEWLREKAALIDERADEVAEEMPTRRLVLEQDAKRLAREVVAVDEAMTRLVVQNAERPLPASVFEASMGELEQRRARLEEARAVAERQQRQAVDDVSAAAAGLLEEWEELTVTQRREALRAGLIDCVVVRTGRPRYTYIRVVEWHEVRG